MKQLPLRLTKYHFFPEITSIPAELWNELVKRLKREMPKPARLKVGAAITNMWNSILDPNGTVTQCPPPPKGIPADEMSKLCSHIARAERIFVSSYDIDAFTLPRFTRDLTDVELAFMAVVGYYSDDLKMTRDALNCLGQCGQLDYCVPYDTLLDTAADLADTPKRGVEFFKCLDRLVQLGNDQDYDIAEVALRQKADHLISTNCQSQGVKIYEELQQRNPLSVENYASLGYSLLDTFDVEEAIPFLTRAFQLAAMDGDVEEAHFIGDTLVQLQVFSEDELDNILESIDEAIFDEMDIDEDLMDSMSQEHPEYAEVLISGEPDGAAMEAHMHLALHGLVERQLEDNDFDYVRQALIRLTGRGLSRHEAIHEIMEVISGSMLHASAKESIGRMQEKFTREIDALGKSL